MYRLVIFIHDVWNAQNNFNMEGPHVSMRVYRDGPHK